MLTRARAVVTLLLAASALTCREASGPERLLGPRAAIAAPTANGSCQLDLTSPNDESVFFVLGALDEYLGRTFIEDDDLIDKFYCNEHPAAAVFQRHVEAVAAQQGLDPNIREETVQNCVLFFRSKVIADRLNSCYRFEASGREGLSKAADGTYRRMARASIEIQLFMHEGRGAIGENGLPNTIFYRTRALAFVAGAWIRYRRGPDFVFANARHKAELIASLLSNLGCRDSRVESTVGLVPQANIVHFNPTEEVKSWLTRDW